MAKGDSRILLLIEARRLLGLSQGALGELLGVSRRTGQRWETTGTRPSAAQWAELARHVHPHDPECAEQLAAEGDTTLQALGLNGSPDAGASLASGAATHPLSRPILPPEVVDSVVCAAAEAMDVKPSQMRPALLAAFERARTIGLRVEDVTEALKARG